MSQGLYSIIISIYLMLFLINGCAFTKPKTAEVNRPVKKEMTAPLIEHPKPKVKTTVSTPLHISPKIEAQKKKIKTQPVKAKAKVKTKKVKTSKSFRGLKKEDHLVTLDFKDEKFCNVLKVFSYITGKNVIAPDKLSDREISIYLKNVHPRSAIQAICEKYHLWYEENKDYIRLRDLGRYGRVIMSQGKIKELRFEGQNLDDVLSVISNITGQNVTCNENIAKKKVTLHLENVPVRVAIELICKKYNLWYRDNRDYIRIMSAEDYGRDTPVDYKIKTRVFNLKYASAPQLADAIGCVMGERVEYNLPTNLESYVHIKLPDVTKKHTEPTQAKQTTEVAKEVKIPVYEKELTSQKLQELMKKKLNLSLTSEDIRWIDKKIGFAIISIFMRNNCILACSADDRILDEIQKLIQKLDTPTPQVLLECKILRFHLNDNFTSFFDLLDFRHKGGKGIYVIPEMRGIWEYFRASASGLYPAGIPLAAGELWQKIVDKDTGAVRWERPPFKGTPGKEIIPGSGMYRMERQPMEKGTGLGIKMELLAEQGLIDTIASPTITAAQNCEAEIYSGMVDVPLFQDIKVVPPVVSETTVVPGYTVPVFKRVQVGTKLKITPQINEDKSVTMRVYVEESAIDKGEAEILYVPEPGKGWEHTSVDVKTEDSTDTIIVVPEGHTLAIGGLTREKNRKVVKKTPFLGDIPILGNLFKDYRTEKERTELVFLVRPHIVMNPKNVGKMTKGALNTYEHPYIKKGQERLFERKGMKLKRIQSPSPTGDKKDKKSERVRK